MSIYGFHRGIPATAYGTLTDTNATAILTANNLAKRRCVVVGIVITNHSGGALTPIVDLYDGSSAYIIRDNASLADTATAEVSIPGGFYDLLSGKSIRITANSGLSWHVSYIEPDPYGGNI